MLLNKPLIIKCICTYPSKGWVSFRIIQCMIHTYAEVHLRVKDTWWNSLCSMFLWYPNRKAELFVAVGDYPGAAAYVHSVLDYCRHRSEAECVCPSLHVRALIFAAELQCCCATATSAPAGSISLLTTALALAQLHYLDYLAALVALHLANLQVGRLAKVMD